MNANTCLQYCINGMSDRLFSFAKTTEGKKLIAVYKKFCFIRETQIKELLIAYNSYFMVAAVLKLKGLPEHPRYVIEFMASEEFNSLHIELTKSIEDNYPMLMSCLNKKQKRKLDALFA